MIVNFSTRFHFGFCDVLTVDFSNCQVASLFSTVDFDQTPKLNWLVLLPSVLAIGAALAHLRICSAQWRIAALLIGTYAGLFLWLIPSYVGMIAVWISMGMGVFLLLAYVNTLTVILLSPGLVALARKAWKGLPGNPTMDHQLRL